ncbi:cadmium-exporting ATPase [Clostridium sp. CAG:448]|nr:cadmium-exporting ATPase [Clostridium sp. CAG:448]
MFGLTKKQSKVAIRILISALLLLAVNLIIRLALPQLEEKENAVFALLLYLIPYLVIGYDILWRAVCNIAHGQVFDENFLMVIATLGVLAIGFFPDGEAEYNDAVFVMLLYQVGELFQNIAVGKSRKSIASLMEIRPDSANLERDGQILQVAPEEVAVGDIIVIHPGEKVPLDGVVTEGHSGLNTVALTGESAPREVDVGDDVISGCINMNGVLRVRVTKVYGESTVAKILELVESSGENKSKSEAFITRFAKYYTPIVVFSALALAIIPPLFTGNWVSWITTALTFLVVSCPCALVISVPLSFFGGIGGASRCGILIKGSNYLEALAKCEAVVFDKTGTLTKGNFKVTAVHPEKISADSLLDFAATAESYSDHPISLSLKLAYAKAIDNSRVGKVEELAGFGVMAVIDGHTVYVGNSKLMAKIGVVWHDCEKIGTVVHVAVDGVYEGHIVVSDELKPDAVDAINALRHCGVKRTVMLTGDTERVGRAVADELGVDEMHAGLLPADKVSYVEKMLQEKSANGVLAFVGDGINDAPVLARADVGIAMGALGSDAAVEAADIVLMDDKPSKIAKAIGISRKTLRIVRENIIFAIAVKVLVLIMTALPFFTVPMWIAIFADVGVCVIAVCNAMRALHSGRVGEVPPRKPAIAFPAQTENGEDDNKKIKM